MLNMKPLKQSFLSEHKIQKNNLFSISDNSLKFPRISSKNFDYHKISDGSLSDASKSLDSKKIHLKKKKKIELILLHMKKEKVLSYLYIFNLLSRLRRKTILILAKKFLILWTFMEFKKKIKLN